MRIWILRMKDMMSKRKIEMSTFVLPTDVIFYIYPQGDQQAKTFEYILAESTNVLP